MAARFRVSKRTLVRIACWVAIILIAPFAIEILLIVDVVGAEAALASLFLYGKAALASLRTRFTLARSAVLAFIRATPGQDLFSRKVVVLNSAFAVVAWFVTGSLLASAVLWLPSLALLAQHT